MTLFAKSHAFHPCLVLCVFWHIFLLAAQVDENVVAKPKARLYTGENLTGTFVDFNVRAKANPKCLTLSKGMRGTIKSINTFGTCVRLYDDTHCWQTSMAFYPSPTPQNGGRQAFLAEVKSIGPCFENELDQTKTELDTGGSKTYTKLVSPKNGLHFIPDVVVFGSVGNFNDTSTTPIDYYRTGHNGRLEYVRATIRRRHVKKVEVINVSERDQQFYTQSEKEEGDQLGHFVNGALGPQKSLPFHNIFAQTPHNRQMMSEMDSAIVDKLCQTNGIIYFYMNVDHATNTSIRPTGMTYVIEFNGRILRMKYLSNSQ